MPIIGGGGAGNVAGSNPAGVGSNLNIIGKHAYAYTGLITSPAGASTQHTALKFKTPVNTYIVGYGNWGYAAATSSDLTAIIEINGEVIFREVVPDGDSIDSPIFWPMILPPDSIIEIKYIFDNGSDNIWFALTGEVYA
tara:strand:- start:35 stop:451 length:417 start_codon:yes stop_codon:yes gene_type:complete